MLFSPVFEADWGGMYAGLENSDRSATVQEHELMISEWVVGSWQLGLLG